MLNRLAFHSLIPRIYTCHTTITITNCGCMKPVSCGENNYERTSRDKTGANYSNIACKHGASAGTLR